MDINWAIKTAVNTGKVELGAKQTRSAAKAAKAKMIIRAKNCPFPEFRSEQHGTVPIYTYPGSGQELGAACGKAFAVAVCAVIDPGTSGITALLKQ
jgi:large subunit ribosomal protein L30e